MNTSSARFFTRLTLISCLAFALVLGALTSPSQAQKVRADFFGMHDGQIANGSTPGVKNAAIRLWDSGTTWREIETSPNVYDFSKVSAAVTTAKVAGLKPLLVLGQTPQFHASKPDEAAAYGPGAASMPDLDAWKAYVKAAATLLGTQVDYEIWNEPNVINYWSGTMKEMALLTATASKVITQVTRGKAKIVAPGFPLRLTKQQNLYKAYWHAKSGGKGMASYVDVVNAHLYPLADQAPEASTKLLSFARKALPKAARKKPMWNTEINYGLLGGPTAKTIPEARQAAFVARTLLINAGGGIQRMYWYSWDIGPIANTHLVLDDRTTLTRAGHAWQEVHGWLIGTTIRSCKQARSGRVKGVYTCMARKSRTEVRRFYWKPTGKAVRISTNKTTRSWTSLGGHTTKRKGSFKIPVGQAPIMVTSRR